MALVDLLILFVIILLPFWYFSKSRREHRRIVKEISKFGGPPCYPILGSSWSLLSLTKEEMYAALEKRNRHYGPLFRSWVGSTPLVHVTKAKHAEVILKSNTNIRKGRTYDFIRPWLGEGLITSTGEYWQRHRKLLTPTFHFKILDSFQEIFSEKGQQLSKQLEKQADGKFFDVYNYIAHCALDIICETAMGVEINAMEDSNSEYVKAIAKITELATYRWFHPWLHSNFIFQYSAACKEQSQAISLVHEFADRVIESRKEIIRSSDGSGELSEEDKLLGKKRRLAFLDLLLQQSQDGNGLSHNEIREEVDTFMFAGHDTTTATVNWTLFALGNHPEIQDKVYEEIFSILHGEDRPITAEDIMKSQYLERVIKESSRLYTVVPNIMRRLSEDIELDGKVVPAGVTVALHLATLHHDPEQFPEPERFDPDRFLPENVSKRNPYSHIPFSAGARNCLGQKFAFRNVKTILISILRKYKVKSKLRHEEVKFYGEITLKPQQGVILSLEPRVL